MGLDLPTLNGLQPENTVELPAHPHTVPMPNAVNVRREGVNRSRKIGFTGDLPSLDIPSHELFTRPSRHKVTIGQGGQGKYCPLFRSLFRPFPNIQFPTGRDVPVTAVRWSCCSWQALRAQYATPSDACALLVRKNNECCAAGANSACHAHVEKG